MKLQDAVQNKRSCYAAMEKKIAIFHTVGDFVVVMIIHLCIKKNIKA